MASNGFWRSENLRLARDERVFATATTVGTPGFLAAVGDKPRQAGRLGIARCLAALGQFHVLHKIEVLRFLAVSPEATPSGNGGIRRFYDKELVGLKELGVRVVHENSALESLVSPAIPDHVDANEVALIAFRRLRDSALVTRILADHFRRQNVLAWNRVEMPDFDKPYVTFNGQVFSGFGFCYLSPLVRWKKDADQPTPCPVLIDCYHNVCAQSHVESFAQRIERATIRGKNRLPVLGLVAARDFDRDAWNDARKRGLMTVSLRQQFGDEALDAMVMIESLMHGLGRTEELAPEDRFEEFSELLTKLKTNPVVVALRSIGFEALAGLILRAEGYEQVELGRIVPWRETTRDVDVYGIRGDELKVIECKAYHRRKSVLGEDVRKFFGQTVPALKAWLRERDRSFSHCAAEIWTTGPLGNEARDELYGMKRPKQNDWKMRRAEDLIDRIPAPLRRRSVELLRAIALTDGDDSDEAS